MKVKHIGGDRDLQEFNEEFPKHGLAVVGFFAAWCGHCKTFKPEWEKFTKQAETSPLEGLVATIPEEHMKHAKCDRSDFQGFPTVRIFRKKGFEDYAGKREAGALMDHIKTLVSQHGGALTDAEVAAPSPAVGSVGDVIMPSDTSTGKWTKGQFQGRVGEPLKVRIHHVDDPKLMTPIAVQDDGEGDGGWFIVFGMGEKENNEWARTSLYRPSTIKSFRLASTGLGGGGGKKIRKRRRRRTRRRRTRRRRTRRRRTRRRRTRRRKTRRRKRRK